MAEDQKFGMRLVEAGIITYEQLNQALKHQSFEDGRLGEILVRLGYVQEATVLQFLAAEFKTRYVSTERLARARIQQHVLDMVPVEIAEKYNLIPVLYDSQTDTLSIVTSEPQNEAQLREVHRLTKVKELRVYVALRSAVQAAIRKHYYRDSKAFDQLLKYQDMPYTNQYQDMSPGSSFNYHNAGSSSNVFSGSPHTPYYDPNQVSSPFGQSPNNYYNPNYPYDYGNYNNLQSPYQNYSEYSSSEQNYDFEDDDEFEKTRIHPTSLAPFQDAESGALSAEGLSVSPSPQISPALASPKTPLAQFPPTSGELKLLELIRFLVKKVEFQHPRYRYHLSRQRPLLEAILKRFELHPSENQYIHLALNLHHIDLPDPHYTLLTIEQNPEQKEEIAKKHADFIEKLKSFHLPEVVVNILTHLYEKVDGTGFPEGLSEEKIPLGSKIIALLDSYEEILQNEADLTPLEAAEKLAEYTDKLFDKKIFEFFREEVERFEKYRKGEIPNVLLVDSDTSIAQKIEKNLWNRGYWVNYCSNIKIAEEKLKEEKLDLIIIDPKIDPDRDIFQWIEQIKEKNNAPEFIILSTLESQEQIERAMNVARDFLEKSSNPGILATKLIKHLENITKEKQKRQREARKTAGLSGSLEQLGLADLLQVLSQSRRTGRLTLTNEGEEGFIFLEDGQVVNAIYNDSKGEPAFGLLMLWEKGEFLFTPNIKSEEKLINKKLDGLILDTLRVIDESRRDGIDNPFDFPSSEFMAVFEEDGEEYEELSLEFDEEKSDENSQESKAEK